MVDFNKILQRQDYVKMTKSLRDKCDELEMEISSKMEELELSGIGGIGVSVNGITIYCVCGYLFVRTPELDVDFMNQYQMIRSSNEEPIKEDIFDDNCDNNFSFISCSNKHALRFLNNAAAIIEELGRIEQKKVDDINQAMLSAPNLDK